MKLIATLLMLFNITFFSFCKSKKIPFKYQPHRITKQTLEIVNGMSNSLEDAYIGIAGSKSAQYTQFENLLELATEDELAELTNHPNPAVRCYSFLGLVKLKSKKIKPILEVHIKDTEKLDYMQGCIIMPYTVIRFMLETITNSKENETYNLVSKEELDYLKKKANIK